MDKYKVHGGDERKIFGLPEFVVRFRPVLAVSEEDYISRDTIEDNIGPGISSWGIPPPQAGISDDPIFDFLHEEEEGGFGEEDLSLFEIDEMRELSKDEFVDFLIDEFKQRISTFKNNGISDLSEAAERKVPDLKGKKEEYLKNSELLDYLGTSPEEFLEMRQNGKSIAEIAKDKGLPVEDVENLIYEILTDDWEQKVKEGVLSQEKYDCLLEDLEEIIYKFLNGSEPLRRINN